MRNSGPKAPKAIQTLINKSEKEILDPLDRRLLTLALSERIDQEALEAFLRDWDIEKAPIKSVMLMAYLMKTHEEVRFPADITPRLNGVLSFCRFQNLKRCAHLSKVGAALNGVGIPFAILKGGAMKVYRPDFPRWMNDIDILVPEDRYKEAVDLGVKLGYRKSADTDHSVDLHLPDSGEGLIDIHKKLETVNGKEDKLNPGLFSRAERREMFSVQGLLPCPEDMVFVLLFELFKNCARNEQQESKLMAFFDIKYLVGLKPDFDWEIVLDNAAKTSTMFQVWFSASVLSQIVPDVFPEDLRVRIADDLGKKEFEKQTVDFLFKRDVLTSTREKFQETAVGRHVLHDYNPLVFVWVGFVNVMKGIFKSTTVKRIILEIRHRKTD